MVTPEKPRDVFRDKLHKKKDDDLKSVSFFNTNNPFYSTKDKTKSKKNNNCYVCRLKPVKIVSDMVDIEDPNMLEKIEEKENDNIKTCCCESSNQINNCNVCGTYSKEKDKERKIFINYNRFNYDINSQKKNFEGKFFLIL